MWPFKAKTTKEEAIKEMQELKEAYRKEYPACFVPMEGYPNGRGIGFLVGSTLVNNYKKGDSARFWELEKIINS